MEEIIREMARRYREKLAVSRAALSPEAERAAFDAWAHSFSEATLVLKKAFNAEAGEAGPRIEAQMVRRNFPGGKSLAGIRYQLGERSWVIETVFPELRIYRIDKLSDHPGEPAVCFSFSMGNSRMEAGGLSLLPAEAALAVFRTMVE